MGGVDSDLDCERLHSGLRCHDCQGCPDVVYCLIVRCALHGCRRWAQAFPRASSACACVDATTKQGRGSQSQRRAESEVQG